MTHLWRELKRISVRDYFMVKFLSPQDIIIPSKKERQKFQFDAADVWLRFSLFSYKERL